MTPKEKAQELLSKYTSITLKEVVPGIFLAFDEELCKKFALIAVDELINEVYNISHQYTAVYDEETKSYNYTDSKELKFWKEVIKEIEKL
jgi:hypothetical protein